MLGRISRRAFRAISAASVAASLVDPALACTRTLFVGQDGTVITGRNMDWKEDMATNLWVLPAGMQRDGAAGPNSLKWTSKYGSVVASGYEAGTADGMNEKGLVVNLLYLAEAEYSKPDKTKPDLSIAAWAQIVLDSYANVAEAVTGLEANSFDILAPTLPNGSPASLHLSISDSGGDSAIFEFLDGKLTIHHGRDYTVMTNSPVYSQQLAIDAYWKSIGGLTFLPGTNRAADRFARASFLIESVPKAIAPQYIKGVPPVLRQSGGRRGDERAAGRQRAARHHDAERAEHLLDDLAHGLRPEEPPLLFRLRHASEHLLGRAGQAGPEARREGPQAGSR
jgi:choloylglycine hydrolase